MICGSMFSGKTEELIRRLRRAQFANLRVEIFKPCVDTRYSDEEVVSHDAHAILVIHSVHRYGIIVCGSCLPEAAALECSGGHGDVFAAALYRISRLTVRGNERISGLHRRIEHHSVAHTEVEEISAAHA